MQEVCFTCSQNIQDDSNDSSNNVNLKSSFNVAHLDKLKCILPVHLCVAPIMKICKPCMENLDTAYNFLKTVVASQIKLRNDNGTQDKALLQYKNILDEPRCTRNVLKIKPNLFDLIKESRSKFPKKITNTKTYECSVCNLSFSKESIYKKHAIHCTEIVNTSVLYLCDCCNKTFDNTKDLRTHECIGNIFGDVKLEEECEEAKVTVKRGKGRPKQILSVNCNICGAVFAKNWMMRKHIDRVHGEEKPYVCTYCNRGFKQSYHLREHLTTHTGERNYSCNICGKAFQRVSSQRRHMKSHDALPGQKTKRTPFLCTVCGKSFPFSNGVQRHMRTHLGIKKHECSICQKKFNQSTHLMVHMRTHTGEKPFICDICGCSFALKSSLQKHKNSHEFNSDINKKIESVIIEMDVSENEDVKPINDLNLQENVENIEILGDPLL